MKFISSEINRILRGDRKVVYFSADIESCDRKRNMHITVWFKYYLYSKVTLASCEFRDNVSRIYFDNLKIEILYNDTINKV